MVDSRKRAPKIEAEADGDVARVPACHPPLPGTRLPIVFVPRKRCPFCDAAGPKITGGRDLLNGARLQYARCRQCGKRFKILLD